MRADRLLSIMLILQAQGKTTTLALAETLEVSMVDVRLSSLEEARMVVLGLGPDAEIIEPDVLREAVLLQAQQIVARFSPPRRQM